MNRQARWAMVAAVGLIAGCGLNPPVDVPNPFVSVGAGVKVVPGQGLDSAPGVGEGDIGAGVGGGAGGGQAFLWTPLVVAQGEALGVDHGVVLLLPDEWWHDVVSSTGEHPLSDYEEGAGEARGSEGEAEGLADVDPGVAVAGTAREEGLKLAGAAVEGGSGRRLVQLAMVACGRAMVRPDGYRGRDLPEGAPLVEHVVQAGESWWLYGRRHALAYDDLAVLNALDVEVVERGAGLVTGERIWLLAREGEARRGRFGFCGGEGQPEVTVDGRWLVFPDGGGVVYRAAGGADVLAQGTVPALVDPGARWMHGGARWSWAEHARRSGVPVEALLRYNGVRAEAVAQGERPAHGALIAWPAREG